MSAFAALAIHSSSMMTIPTTLPVMVLPNCSLFPEGRLPLFIFEPRYRQMLYDALQGDRMFCIGTTLGEDAGEPDAPIEPFSTAGLVRACVGKKDGTSHLILEGLKRVRFIGWVEGKPYRLARVEAVLTVDPNPVVTQRLNEEIKGLAGVRLRRAGFESAESLDARWESLGGGERLADFIAYHLVSDVERRQPMLAMPSLPDRLEFLRECLREL